MRVVIYGDASPGSGGWCYAETLREMGHGVTQVQEAALGNVWQTSFASRVWRKLSRGFSISPFLGNITCLQETVESLKPEIVIILKGLHVSYANITMLRRMGAWVCNINHDDFFSLNPNNRSCLQRKAIPAFDHIFTTREVNVEEVRPFNPKVEFFPFAYYPRIHRVVDIPLGERDIWNVDIVFVGTYEAPRAAMLELLVQELNFRIAIYGAQWDKLPRGSLLRPHLRAKDVRFDSLAKAIGGAKISLGFLRKENRDDYTQRTFEIPACGGVLLAERTKRHSDLYREGIEAEFFDPNSVSELKEKIVKLLGSSDKRESMRDAGRTALESGCHTYRHRLERLVDVYSSQPHG